MSTLRIIKIMAFHDVETKIENNAVLALEAMYDTVNKCDCSQWVDITGWNDEQALAFLGYCPLQIEEYLNN